MISLQEIVVSPLSVQTGCSESFTFSINPEFALWANHDVYTGRHTRVDGVPDHLVYKNTSDIQLGDLMITKSALCDNN